MNLKNYQYSKHALEQIENRKLDKSQIDRTINRPDNVLNHDDCLTIFQKIVSEKMKKQYLYRVFINICKKPPLVVTAYKTSKITKYENKI